MRIDDLPHDEAVRALLAVCASPAWAAAVAKRRPFGSPDALLAAADAELAALDGPGIADALAGHPRIGERTHSASSAREQAGMASASDEVRAAMAAGNAEYEERFGHVYLVCASGRSAAELLAVLQERLGNTADEEAARTRAELAAINRLRLTGLAGSHDVSHPEAPVPEHLFDDEREQRWRARFTAVRMSRPAWALDAPDRCLYTSNASGTTQVHAWDRGTDSHRQVTERPAGTYLATLPPDGEAIWWFADTDGDEFGHWLAEPWAGGPAENPLPGVEDGYPAGLDIGRGTIAVGTSTDTGTSIWVQRKGSAAARVYQHAEDAGVGGLSEDETLLAISHSEHGDSRHPDLRVLTVDGATVAEKSDGPGKGLGPIAFSPVRGDQRLLVSHERRGREELLIWDVAADTETEIDLGLPGEVYADFYPDASALLVWHTHAARTRLHRYDLATGELTELPTAPGCIGSADVRPDGTVEYSSSSAAAPSTVRALSPDGTDSRLLTPPGEPAPGSVPVTDLWVDGPGGRVHALVSTPAPDPAHPGGPFPAVFALHGGPHAADEDRFSPARAAWVEAGFVVVEVNYRGSTGYGSPWRDAIEGRPGLTELEDLAAVHAAVVAGGTVDPARTVVEGWSWGGYLALLAAGTQPDRWAAAIGGVPVADYLAAYSDEMEQLRAFDRALFGGSPEEVPETYRTASPLTYVGEVRAPVLVLAGENDPRCPIRQIDNYLDALATRADLPYEVARFDAGHGSLVVAETLRHMATEIDFARRALARITLPAR